MGKQHQVWSRRIASSNCGRRTLALLVTATLQLGVVGCARTTPVAVVSVESSGVAVSAETDRDLSNQWPAWRGPATNGLANTTDAPVKWSEDQIRWQTDIPGRGHGSPIVIDDTVVLTTAVDAEQKQMLLAVDRNTGDVRWTKVVHEGSFPSAGEIHSKATNANSTAASDGEQIYCVFFNGGKIIASAYDLQGESQWRREVGAFNSKFGYAPSPLLYGSLLIVAADNRGGGYIAGLDRKSGKVAWRIKRPAVSTYSSPLIANVGGKDQLVISGCNQICSYDPRDGEPLWSVEGVSEATCGTVVTDGERFFASGGYPERETMAVSADGDIVWSNRTQVYEPSMICVGNLLFAIADNGVTRCWDAETGKKHWETRLNGSFSASPVCADGLIYAPDLDGKTHVFKAADKYESVAVNRLGSDCYASPAIVGREIFLRVGFGNGGGRQERLVCLAEASTESSETPADKR